MCRYGRFRISIQALPLTPRADAIRRFSRMIRENVLGRDWNANDTGNKATAYVLDDEPGIAALVARALKLEGLDVRHFSDAVRCMSKSA